MKSYILFLILIILVNISFADEISKPSVTTGHTKFVSSVAVTPDGKYVLSGSNDKTLKLWDIKSGKELKTFQGHTKAVESIVISPNGKFVLSGSSDLKLWNIETGKEIKAFKGHSSWVMAIAFTPNGKYAVSGSIDKKLKLWDIVSGKEIRTFTGHTDGIYSLAITPDGNYIVSGSKDKTLKLWEIKTGKEIRTFKGHFWTVSSVAVTLDGKFILSSSEDNSLKLWDIKSGKELRTFKGHTDHVNSIAIAPDGKYMLSGSRDKTIKLWDIKSGKELKTYKVNGSGNFVAFTQDGKFAISPSKDNTFKLWDIKSGVNKITFNKSHVLVVKSLAITPDAKYVLSSGGNSLKLWDIKSGQEIGKFENNHTKGISSISITPNGKYALTGSWDKTLKLWDILTGKELKTYIGHAKGIISTVITPDGKFVISGSKDKTLKLWDIHSAKVIRTFEGNSGPLWSVAITPNGKFILSGGGGSAWIRALPGTMMVWDIESGKIIKTIKRISGTVFSMAISPDGKSVFASSVLDSAIENYDIQTGEKLKTLNGHVSVVNTIGIAKKGDILISGSSDNTLRLWNIKTGKEQKTFKGHSNDIKAVAIFPNGKFIFSSSLDGMVKLWNISTGQEIASFVSFQNGEWIVITPEGYFNGSKNALQYLNITKYTKNGMEPFDVSQLYDHFFRPDLVKLKLSGDEAAFQKATNGLTYQDALKNPPPKLSFKSIDSVETKTTGFEYKAVETKKEKVKLTFNVNEHDGGGVGLIRVYQEGKLIQTIGEGKVNKQSANVDTILEQEKLDSTLKENQKTYIASLSKSIQGDISIEDTIAKVAPKTTTNQSGTYDLEIELKSGKNEISIEAFNKTNTVTSYRENITINANIPKQKPKLYAIIAGVNEFEAPSVNNLKYSQNDAQAIKEAAQKKMKTVFDDVEVIYLTGKEVTKENILKAAQNIAKKAKLDDTVLFYISTHGRAARGKLYLVPYNNKSVKNWIDFEQTFQAVQSIKALNQIFIIDACESGKANDIVSSVYDSRASVLAKSSGVHMLLATTKGTSAFEHPDPSIKNGVFTHRILQAMNNKTTDANKDNLISIQELSKKLKEPTNNADYQYPVIRNVGKDVELERVAN